jgi:alpha-N-acetylglucosaminidase
MKHPPATETVSRIHTTLTSRHESKNFLNSVQEVIDRVLLRGKVNFKFQPKLEIIDYETRDGQLFDVFEVDGQAGSVVLRGSSAVALTTAFGHYLRYHTNCDLHWEDGGDYSLAAFPATADKLPIPLKNERTVFLSKWRYYQNTCTASYSFAWKNWNQWEADIDWMALNGYNLPLAFTGQELVWQQLWRQYGVSDEGLQEYFSGPAFLTWQRMANIRAYGGPLSDSWINQQADLQRNILQRYYDLGMVPVMPAFNGVVPAEMQKLFPSANITRLSTWNNFPEEYSCNYILSATDPLFVDIGKAFLELQFDVWGAEMSKSHIYNCDTFNENKPASSDYDYLAGSSSAVYNSMIAADPDAIWLMQGWLFVNDREFWTDANIASYLAGVPDHGMVILDLSSEDLPVWDKIAANHKQFLWCMLHNYGGRRAMYGNLTLLATDPIDVANAVPGYFLGTGLTMEAIDQNPIVYEFMSEMAWQRTPPNVPAWVARYAQRRYGLAQTTMPEATKGLVEAAWAGLFVNNYNGETPVCHHPCSRQSIITEKPTWTMYQDKSTGATVLVDVWSSMVLAARNMTKFDSETNRAYAYDLVDVGRQVMTNLFLDYYTIAQHFYNANDALGLQYIMKDMLVLIHDLDNLLATHESYLLGKWIAGARSWAKDETEADLFDFNARNQVTLWGDNGEIDDYAAKNWAGLVGKYYLPRWQLFLQMSLTALRGNSTLDVDRYNSDELYVGQTFCHDTKNSFDAAPKGNTYNVSTDLHAKYGNSYHSAHGYILRQNTDVSSSANIVPQPLWTGNIRQLQRICDATLYCVGFTTEGLLKNDEYNLIPREGVHFFVKGKCSIEESTGKIRC